MERVGENGHFHGEVAQNGIVVKCEFQDQAGIYVLTIRDTSEPDEILLSSDPNTAQEKFELAKLWLREYKPGNAGDLIRWMMVYGDIFNL